MPDDQLALVPRAFAAAFFTEHLFAEAAKPNRTMKDREAEYALMAANIAGPAPHPLPKPSVLPVGALRCGYWQGKTSLGAQELDTQPSTSFGAEANLLYRLQLRRVPLVVRALPAHLTRHSPHGDGSVVPMYMDWPNAS